MIGVRDRAGLPLAVVDGGVTVDEGAVVVLDVPEGARVRAGRLPLPWSAVHGGVLVDTRFEAGALHELCVEHAGGAWPLAIRVQPARAKLAPTAWLALLDALDGWMPALRIGAEGARSGGVGRTGAESPLLVQALLPLVPELVRALDALLAAPRHVRERHRAMVPLHRARRARPETVRWLGRRSDVAGHALGGGSGPPPRVPVPRLRDTLDHPANRHIVWMVGRVVAALRAGATRLDPLADDPDALTARPFWCRERARALREAAEAVERRLARSVLGDLVPAPADEGALLVVVDHPRYRRVHALARRFLAARFDHAAERDTVPVRPSFDLYELWTVLALRDALDAAVPGLEWGPSSGFEGLLDLSVDAASWAASGGGRTLTIEFNRTFSYRKTPGEGPWSVTRRRRPDLCLRWDGPTPGWLCFDAKYRAGREALSQELQKAHIYRDALRWGAWGRPAACLLLVPAHSADAAHWFRPAFWRAHRVGVAEAQPGRPPAPDLVAFLAETLAG